MPKGIFERTEEHKNISRNNGKNQIGRLPVNAKYVVGFMKDDFEIIERLTPIGESKTITFQCRCVECGELREITNKNFAQNDKTKCSKKNRPSNWTGHELISGSYWKRIQKQAQDRNIIFDYNINDAWELYKKQNGKCAYTGIDITFSKQKSGNTASFDRIDSNKGYVDSNVHWVHKDVNMMKRNFTETYFISLCEKVITNRSKI